MDNWLRRYKYNRWQTVPGPCRHCSAEIQPRPAFMPGQAMLTCDRCGTPVVVKIQEVPDYRRFGPPLGYPKAV